VTGGTAKPALSGWPGGTTDVVGSLADVLPAAAGLLGVDLGAAPTQHRSGILPVDADDAEAVTVLLVDGLGWWPWQAHADLTPTLASMSARQLTSTVPSTTPTALASLGTGRMPGAHGIVGAAFRLPEDDLVLHPLTWGGEPHPVAVQPERTVFESVAAAGLPVARIGASAYSDSGLTRAVLRGGEYVAADTDDDIVDAVAMHSRGLAYAYLADLDRIGHVHGTGSREWRECLVRVDRLVESIIDRMPAGHHLLVTADHGMVDCMSGARVVMESLPSFDDVTIMAGEPRLRHVYVAPGKAAQVAREWSEALEERAWVMTREEFLASGLIGATEPDYAGRVGDIVVLARDDTVLVSAVDPLVSGLVGQHGSITDVEMRIPLLGAAGGGHG
jgi:hypothetical protein